MSSELSSLELLAKDGFRPVLSFEGVSFEWRLLGADGI